MAAIGGSIESIDIDGRIFPVAADADVNVKLGGKEKELQMNGDGTPRFVLTAVGWMLDGVTVSIDHDRGDQEFLQERADETSGNSAIGITLVHGVTFSGKGTIVGELQLSTQNATCGVSLAGGGKLEQQ